MKSLSPRAQRVFEKLTVGLTETNQERTVGDGEPFMSVYVAWLFPMPKGAVYSITHYGERNGDLCCDPNITFFRDNRTGKVYPLTFQQANPRIHHEAVSADGFTLHMVNSNRQADITKFADTWMANIAEQQDLDTIQQAEPAKGDRRCQH